MARRKELDVTNENAAPGWYPTPDGTQRYWDGSQWTDNVAQPGSAGAGGSGPEPATPKDERPLWKKKRFLIPVAVLIIALLINTLGGGGDDAAEEALPSPTPEVTEEEATQTATDEPTETAPAEEATDEATDPGEDIGAVFDEMFGTFAIVTETGSGDTVITLPDAAAGRVTATHSGSANFVINVLDAANEMSGDLLVNTIGSYAGTTAWGLSALSDEGVKLQVVADGAWTIELAPISAAPVIEPSTQGEGDIVLLLDGAAADWAVTHDGDRNFVVLQVGDGFPNLAVNEIGSYSGTVPLLGGPTVISVMADGAWDFTKK